MSPRSDLQSPRAQQLISSALRQRLRSPTPPQLTPQHLQPEPRKSPSPLPVRETIVLTHRTSTEDQIAAARMPALLEDLTAASRPPPRDEKPGAAERRPSHPPAREDSQTTTPALARQEPQTNSATRLPVASIEEWLRRFQQLFPVEEPMNMSLQLIGFRIEPVFKPQGNTPLPPPPPRDMAPMPVPPRTLLLRSQSTGQPPDPEAPPSAVPLIRALLQHSHSLVSTAQQTDSLLGSPRQSPSPAAQQSLVPPPVHQHQHISAPLPSLLDLPILPPPHLAAQHPGWTPQSAPQMSFPPFPYPLLPQFNPNPSQLSSYPPHLGQQPPPTGQHLPIPVAPPPQPPFPRAQKPALLPTPSTSQQAWNSQSLALNSQANPSLPLHPESPGRNTPLQRLLSSPSNPASSPPPRGRRLRPLELNTLLQQHQQQQELQSQYHQRMLQSLQPQLPGLLTSSSQDLEPREPLSPSRSSRRSPASRPAIPPFRRRSGEPYPLPRTSHSQ